MSPRPQAGAGGGVLCAGPYVHAPTSVAATMGWVMLALLPATAFSLYQFGWPAIFLFFTTVASALVAEALALLLMGKRLRPFLLDGSAVLTAWLLALTLPPWAPWWIGVTGGLIAIIIGKQVFGGIGQNLFNPAMVARVALLISFPLEMTLFPAPQPLGSPQAPGLSEGLAIFLGTSERLDALTSATPLGHVKTELTRGIGVDQTLAGSDPLGALFLGTASGSLGEISALLILAGGLLLLWRRVIAWKIPVAMLGTLALISGICHWLDPQRFADPLFHLFAGGAMLGAFFIATDPVTSPVSARGQLLFGAGCGALVFIIRSFAGYPEGVAFAVLLMNACTPLIDHYLRPRIYGRDRRGRPLQGESREPPR